MPQALTLVTGPAAEPVSLAEVKSWARIDAATDDALIATLITAAAQAAEQYLRRSLITQTWRLTLDLPASGLADRLGEGVYDLPVTALYGGLPQAFRLPKGPVQSVASLATYDTSNASSTYASTNYYLDTAGDRLVLNETAVWPSPLRPLGAATVTYVAGYGDTASSVPQPIRTAILIAAAALYDTRGQCEGDGDLPPAARRLLGPYRVLGDPRA